MSVEIIKPKTDDRLYRLVTLSNGLEALLVSDAATEKAAAALDVHIGSLADPDDLPGLAHFLEHLLFMGTKKYPDESEYSKFLTDHAGSGNAFTSAEHTNYHFEVASNALEGALDRFAQFFIAPLFSKSCQEREVLAVDSENKKNLQSDVWRLSQLEKSLSNPSHPWHKFSTGNYETLGKIPESKGIDVRQRLIEFYEQHYSASLMKLTVLGAESLDTLERWVTDLFSVVPSDSAKQPMSFSEAPILHSELGTLIKAKPVMDVKQLEVAFPVPDQQSLYAIQPFHHFAHLIGHESDGSVFHYLKEKGWATELSCGTAHICKGHDKFIIDVELTNSGFEHWREVHKALFAYIEMIKAAGPQLSVFEELKTMGAADFDYRQKSKPVAFARNLAGVLHRPIPRERVLNFGVVTEYDPQALIKFGNYLTFDNSRATLVSQSLDHLDKRESWYGTEYSVGPLTFLEDDEARDVADGLKHELHLPDPNSFIPASFELKGSKAAQRSERPTLLRRDDDQQGLRVWHKKDDTFLLPKAVGYLKLLTPMVSDSAHSFMLAELFVAALTDSLTSRIYYAHAAGLQYAMGCAQDGFKVEVAGFNDKLPKLVRTIIDEFMGYGTQELRRRFDFLKERIVRLLENSKFMPPYSQLTVNSSFLLVENAYSLDEKLAAIENIRLEDVEKYIDDVRAGHFAIELLCVGNIEADTVLQLATELRGVLGPALNFVKQSRSYVLPEGLNVYYKKALADPANVNNAIDYNLQFGTSLDLRRRAALELLAQVMSEPVFHELRTVEQLGYVVGSAMRPLRQTLYLRIYAQSEAPATYLEARVEHLLSTTVKSLITEISDEDWKKAVASVVHRNTEKPKNMTEEATQFWAVISTRRYDFTRRRELAKLAGEITKGELLELFEKLIDPASPERTKFSLLLEAQKQSPSKHQPVDYNGKEITDTDAFKEGLKLADSGEDRNLALYEADSKL